MFTSFWRICNVVIGFQVLVFCTTAMVTRLVADLLGELNLNVREIHSRKPQSYRTRVSDEFRKSKGLILVTSDVSARGVDYPDVTLVVQVIYVELLPCFNSTTILSITSMFTPIP
jgi:superfamily II DNA/RNA helicase